MQYDVLSEKIRFNIHNNNEIIGMANASIQYFTKDNIQSIVVEKIEILLHDYNIIGKFGFLTNENFTGIYDIKFDDCINVPEISEMMPKYINEVIGVYNYIYDKFKADGYRIPSLNNK